MKSFLTCAARFRPRYRGADGANNPVLADAPAPEFLPTKATKSICLQKK